MGIKHLWTVLTPFCERKPLYELRGKTVAIDLSCWICEAQNIAEYHVQPRMYLRNLYFRTCYLLLMEVNPVFVLEGKAPELKYDTIAARNELQFKGAKPKTSGVRTGKDRTRFHFILKRCEEMLGFMGLACVKGKGEAESMCAYLNDEGLVDGCISQDSDCFAYGAKVVYRNFSVAAQGPHRASGGAVDIYDINKPYQSINFGRNKILAMALLCGSDYNEGVQGVGKESVMKYFENVSDKDVLERIKCWKTKPESFEFLESEMNDKNICTSCGHGGKLVVHNKVGCLFCKTRQGCDSSTFKEHRLSIKNELNIRNKALQDSNFPNEKLLQEFLVKKDCVSELNLKWKRPNVVSFVNFTSKYLEWEEVYALQKILPILTRWQCLNRNSDILRPDRIKKARNPKGVPSYEIIWSDPNDLFKSLVTEDKLEANKITAEQLFTTIEPQALIDAAYPELVEQFRQSKIKPPKVSKRKKKQPENTSLSEPVDKKVRKTRGRKKKTDKNDEIDKLENSMSDLRINAQRTLDNYFENPTHHAFEKQKLKGYQCDVFTSTPVKSSKEAHSNLGRHSTILIEEDEDLSEIIEKIVASEQMYKEKYLKNVYVEEIKEDKEKVVFQHVSSFFTNSLLENDVFEQSCNMNADYLDDVSSDDEKTELYSFDEKELKNDGAQQKCEDQAQKENCDDVSNDDSIDRLLKKFL